MKMKERKNELKKMTETKLLGELNKKKQELDKLTIKKSFGKLKDQNRLKNLRRDIGRIKTYLQEKIISELCAKSNHEKEKNSEKT